jgi:hypothetical protein
VSLCPADTGYRSVQSQFAEAQSTPVFRFHGYVTGVFRRPWFSARRLDNWIITADNSAAARIFRKRTR